MTICVLQLGRAADASTKAAVLSVFKRLTLEYAQEAMQKGQFPMQYKAGKAAEPVLQRLLAAALWCNSQELIEAGEQLRLSICPASRRSILLLNLVCSRSASWQACTAAGYTSMYRWSTAYSCSWIALRQCQQSRSLQKVCCIRNWPANNFVSVPGHMCSHLLQIFNSNVTQLFSSSMMFV